MRPVLRGWVALLGFGVMSAGSALAQAGMTATSLGAGVHVLAGYANGNILVLETADGLVLVDAQAMNRVAETDSLLRTLTAAPVRRVIFTHYHEDHTAGMTHWRLGGATAIAHQAVPAEMARDTLIAEMGDWHRKPAPPTAMPDQTFADSTIVTLGGMTLRVLHVPGAHTRGDAIVLVPSQDLMHVGDLVEPGAAPFIDWWAGGSLAGMISAADRILELAGPATRIVPGHGPVIGRAEVLRHREMLVALQGSVSAAFQEGMSRDAFIETRPASTWEDLLGGPRRADAFVRLLWLGRSTGRP